MKSLYAAVYGLTRCVGMLSLALWVVLLVFIVVQGAPGYAHIVTMVTTTDWYPLGDQFGLLYIIVGSLYVSTLAMLLAIPLGIGSAVALVGGVPTRIRNSILAGIDMVAGIPSVIFGFIGLTAVVPFVGTFFRLSTGESILAASLVLAVMILPYMITHSAESLGTYASRYMNSAKQLGIHPWYTMARIVLPAASTSILMSAILAFGRAVGETMAVMMVIGNAPIAPELLGKGATIPSVIALEMGSVQYESMHYHSLYVAAGILILLLGLINGGIAIWAKRKEAGHD